MSVEKCEIEFLYVNDYKDPTDIKDDGFTYQTLEEDLSLSETPHLVFKVTDYGILINKVKNK